MLLHVFEFNKKRNGFKYDGSLEILMYGEEVREFFDATNLAERFDALVDCQYVRLGTQLKMQRNGISLWPYNYDVEYTMEELIRSELKEQFVPFSSFGSTQCSDREDLFSKLLTYSQKIVCKANQIKGSKLDENGKVLKDDAYKERINATKQIALMLEEELKPKNF